jgi:tetratricopeptide (TPR) repeat protein
MGKIKPHLIEIGIFLIVTLLLSIGSHSRNKLWNDEIGLWIDCVKKSPNKARPYTNLGLAYFNAGAYDKSKEMAQKAIQIDPKSAYAYYSLVLTFQKLGNLNEAIAMGKKSLDVDPDLNIVHYSLGVIYFENGQYEEAAEAFNKFLKVFPYFPEVHHLLAIAYAAQKKFDKAIAEFEWELRVNPYHTLAHLNLGQIYWYEFQNREKAIYHLRAALMLDPLLPNRGAIQRLVRSLEGFSS